MFNNNNKNKKDSTYDFSGKSLLLLYFPAALWEVAAARNPSTSESRASVAGGAKHLRKSVARSCRVFEGSPSSVALSPAVSKYPAPSVLLSKRTFLPKASPCCCSL